MMPKYTTGSLPNLENRKTNNSSERDSLQSQQSQVLTRNGNEQFTIAIDWDPTALHLRYQSTLERVGFFEEIFKVKIFNIYVGFSFGLIMIRWPYVVKNKLNP